MKIYHFQRCCGKRNTTVRTLCSCYPASIRIYPTSFFKGGQREPAPPAWMRRSRRPRNRASRNPPQQHRAEARTSQRPV